LPIAKKKKQHSAVVDKPVKVKRADLRLVTGTQKIAQAAAVVQAENEAVFKDNAGTNREGKYEILFQKASDAVITVFPDGRIDAVNKNFQEISGYSKNEIEGQNISILIPDPKKHIIPAHAKPLAKEFFHDSGTYEDIAILRRDGYVRTTDLSVRHVYSDGGYLALSLFRDFTEKKQLERDLITKHAELRNAYFQLEKNNVELKTMQDTLIQAGKMAALGELAAGIAHELNQPLTGIKGYAQELTSVVLPIISGTVKEEVRTDLTEIVSCADKMSKIIGYLRTFVRKSVEEHKVTDIHDAIEEAMKMLGRQFASRGIVVVRKYGKDISKVYANPLQLEQVFINLFTNARDAISEAKRTEGLIEVKTRENENYIEILFKDNGSGMNQMTQKKAFNPFFTTKEVGQGMGLGLSLSYGILSKLHGSIFVESEVGKGTEFLVKIPKDFRELS